MKWLIVILLVLVVTGEGLILAGLSVIDKDLNKPHTEEVKLKPVKNHSISV